MTLIIPRVLLRQRHPQDERRKMGPHHENPQLRPLPHGPRIICSLDGSSECRYAQDRHQCVFDVRVARPDGPDQLRDRQIGDYRTYQISRGRVGEVCICISLIHWVTVLLTWRRYNVRCNAVAYGWMDTRLTKPPTGEDKVVIDGKDIATGIPASARKFRDTSDIPLGRPGTVDDAANVMLFLASPMSSYVTATCIECTGGRYM